MATSPATIVIGLVTAAAFGLAAKDTATGKQFLTPEQEAAAELEKTEAAAAAAEAAYDAEQARAEAAQKTLDDAKQHALLAALPTLLGTDVGPGPMFNGVKFGVDDSMTAEQRAAAVTAFDAAADALGLQTFGGAGTYQWERLVTVPEGTGTPEACGALGDQMLAWGDDHQGVRGSEVHYNPKSYQRVAFSSDYADGSLSRCTVSFDVALTAPEWIEQAAPATLLGKSGDAVRAYITARPEAAGFDDTDDETWSWSIPGVEHGIGRTYVTARFEKTKLAALHASVDVADTTLVHIEDALTANFGKPHEDPYEGETWTRPVLRRITRDGAQLQLDVGE